MARIEYSVTSRNRGAVRLLRWSLLLLAGTGGGLLLGELVVGNRVKGLLDPPPSYSRLSANPDALVPQGEAAAPCLDCADSYGVAAQLRARRDDRMGEEFRELGTVDIDLATPIEPDDDYRYGGRFPDPEPQGGVAAKPIGSIPVTSPVDAIPSGDEMPLPPATD